MRADGYYWVRFADPPRSSCGTSCCTQAFAGKWAIGRYTHASDPIYCWKIFEDQRGGKHSLDDGAFDEIGPFVGPLSGPVEAK